MLADLWSAGARVVGEAPARSGLTVRLERPHGADFRECHLIQLDGEAIVHHVVYPERHTAQADLDLARLEDRMLAGWLGQAVRTEALPAGHSGTRLWRFVMPEGTALVVKRLAQQDSWIMRATGDRGREAALWEAGTLEQLPGIIDHAVVAAAAHDDPPLLVMQDRTRALAAGALADPAVTARVMRGLVAVHDAFRGRPPGGLCGLVDRLGIFSPRTLQREAAGADFAPKVAGRGWELFAELAPEAVGAQVLGLAREPERLAAMLPAAEPTLVHADIRPANLGVLGGRVVLIDWGLATSAPAELDVAWLAWGAHINGSMEPDELVAAYRAAGGRVDPALLEWGLLATLAQTGCYFGFEAVQQPDEERRGRARKQLDWWVARVREILDRGAGHRRMGTTGRRGTPPERTTA